MKKLIIDSSELLLQLQRIIKSEMGTFGVIDTDEVLIAAASGVNNPEYFSLYRRNLLANQAAFFDVLVNLSRNYMTDFLCLHTDIVIECSPYRISILDKLSDNSLFMILWEPGVDDIDKFGVAYHAQKTIQATHEHNKPY